MPDISLTFDEIKTSFLFAMGAAGIAYLALNRLEAVLNPHKREKIYKSIIPNPERTNEELPNWIQQFKYLLDEFFGKKHFSWRCIWRCILISIASAFLFMYFMLIVGFYDPFIDPLDSIFAVATIGTLIILGPFILNPFVDYFSLLESRWIITLIAKSQSNLRVLFLIISDLFLTTIIFFSWAFILLCLFSGEFLDIFSEGKRIILFQGYYGLYFPFFCTTFTTSIWLWLYAFALISAKVIMSFRTGHIYLSRVFDFKNKPVGSLAYLAGIGTFVLFFFGSLTYFSFIGDLPSPSL